jgi:hypothetical protein
VTAAPGGSPSPPLQGRLAWVADAAEDGHDLGLVVCAQVNQGLLDRRAGMGKVRPGQVVQPGEVTGQTSPEGFAIMGAILLY